MIWFQLMVSCLVDIRAFALKNCEGIQLLVSIEVLINGKIIKKKKWSSGRRWYLVSGLVCTVA